MALKPMQIEASNMNGGASKRRMRPIGLKSFLDCRQRTMMWSRTNMLSLICIIGCMLIFAIHMLPFFSYENVPQVEIPPNPEQTSTNNLRQNVPDSKGARMPGEDKYDYYYYRPLEDMAAKSTSKTETTINKDSTSSDDDEAPNNGNEEYKQFALSAGKGSETPTKHAFNATAFELEEDAEQQLLFRMVEMQSILTNVSSPDLLRDMTSPQGKAFDWIVRLDPMELAADDLLAQQRYILAVLFYATKGSNWYYGSHSWLSKSSECDWNDDTFDGSGRVGVFQCDTEGYIIHLQLAQNNLVGTLPTELGKLSRLQNLDLESNRLEGTIPTELGSIVQLENLGLSSNKLSGTIPSELGNIQRLGQLMVHLNDFTGSMPAEVCALTPHTEDGGLLFNLWADCAPHAGLSCDCCSECCDGLNACHTMSEGPMSKTFGSQSIWEMGDDEMYYSMDDDDEMLMLAEEAEAYFDAYGY